MKEFESALSQGGVFRMREAPDIAWFASAAARAGLETKVIDAKRASDKTRFLKLMAISLSLPAYFGENWDAFYDCLTDLAPPAHGRVWLIDGVDQLARMEPEEFAAAIGVFTDAADYWRDAAKSLTVIVVIKRADLAPELTSINSA